MEERILCAAIWFDDGKKYAHQPINIETGIVLCGFRHGCIFQQIGGLVKDRKELGVHEREQGFLTSKNRFIDRREAHKIFVEQGGKPEFDDQLYSEDLY